jgi:hypothetical protein
MLRLKEGRIGSATTIHNVNRPTIAKELSREKPNHDLISLPSPDVLEDIFLASSRSNAEAHLALGSASGEHLQYSFARAIGPRGEPDDRFTQ